MNLEQIVRESVESQLLEQLEINGITFSQQQRENVLRVLRKIGQIDKSVTEIIEDFLKQARRQEYRRSKGFRALLAVVTLSCTIGVGYGTNINNWVFVVICGVILISVELYNIFREP